MTKRNAIRFGNPQSLESVSETVNRYGAMKEESLNELTKWLDEHKKEYSYRLIQEYGNTVLVTNKKGSAIEKFIDNEHDAQNSLANIKNTNFPKRKQGQ